LDALGFRNAAREMLKGAVDRGGPPTLLIPYGARLDAEGRHAEAVAAFRTYLERCPGSDQAAIVYSSVGRSLTFLKDFAPAEEAPARALAAHPGCSPLYLNYADTLRQQQKWDAALEMARRGLGCARDNREKIDLLDLEASVLLSLMRGEEGLACCDE